MDELSVREVDRRGVRGLGKEDPVPAGADGEVHGALDRALGVGVHDELAPSEQSAKERLVLSQAFTPGLRAGTVVVESVWPNAAFEEGIGINALVSAEPGRPNGGAVFHDTAVWLRPA